MMDITEKQFSTQVEDFFKRFGWTYSHTYEQKHFARRSTKGFPDYVTVRPPRLIFVELKSEKGQLTPEQEEWLEVLRECVRQITLNPVPIPIGRKLEIIPSFEVYLWRPSQFEEIAEILR